MDTTTVWTWEIHNGRPEETAQVPAADPLDAMQLYLQERPVPDGAHTFTVRPASAGCPFPEVTVEVRQADGGEAVMQPCADPVAWAEAAAAAAGKRLLAEQWRYLQGPIVVGSVAWTDTPEWLRLAIPKARLRQVLLEISGGAESAGLATLEEVAAYLLAASLDAPLSRDAAEVYFFAAGQVVVRYGLVADFAAFSEMLDGAARELSPYQVAEVLRPLQRRIRQSVVGHAPRAGRMKERAHAVPDN